MSRLFTTIVLGAALGLAGCGSCDGEGAEPEETTTSGAEGQSPAGRFGTVEGIIRLAPGAEVPSYPELRSHIQTQIPESCTPPQLTDRRPVGADAQGGLAGILLQASEFDQDITREPVTHELAIRDCRLTPRFLAAVRGDKIVLTNETDYPFLPTLGQSSLAQAVLFQDSREFPLEQGGIFTMTCSFAAPCARTDLVVVYHPVHTVSTEGGTFRIENFPADEDVRLHGWHPLFQEVSEMVRVGEGETVHVELVIAPSAQAAAQPAEEGEAGQEGEEGQEGQEGEEGQEGQEAGHPEDGSELF